MVFNLLLLVQVVVEKLLAQSSFFYGVIRIITLESLRARVVKFNYLCYNAVQEVAVVRDNNHCPSVILQESFKPRDRSHIKMVCRLVEQYNIRGGEQKFAERHAGFLSAGKRCHFFGKFFLFKTKTF